MDISNKSFSGFADVPLLISSHAAHITYGDKRRRKLNMLYVINEQISILAAIGRSKKVGDKKKELVIFKHDVTLIGGVLRNLRK